MLSYLNFPKELFLPLFIHGLQLYVHAYVQLLNTSNVLDAYEIALIAE